MNLTNCCVASFVVSLPHIEGALGLVYVGFGFSDTIIAELVHSMVVQVGCLP